MNIENVEITTLYADPGNVRKHSERNLEAIKGSLRRFGQQKPIVVDGNNIVRAGNGTLAAAQQLGWTHIKIIRTALTGSEATAFAIADNRAGDPDVGSTFDPESLAQTLTALRAEDADLAHAAGFTVDELAQLLGDGQNTALAEAPADFTEYGSDIQTEHECPKCKFRWSGSSAPQEAT